MGNVCTKTTAGVSVEADAFSSLKSLGFGIVAYSIVIWQLISNYVLIRFKIFISYKTVIV